MGPTSRFRVLVLLTALLAIAAPWGAADAIASVPPGETTSPAPSTEPSPDPSPSPEPSPSPDPSPTPSPTPNPSPTPTPSPSVHGSRVVPSSGPVSAAERLAPVGGPPSAFDQPPEAGSPNHAPTQDLSTEQLLSGSYSTERLVAAAALLRAAGWSEDRTRREVYAPFILVGPASWVDSWHARRYGPGSIVRQHEGQDVLCRHGTEVLAPEDGTIEFETGLLGGRSAHLFLPDGGYYYFAHFVDWNDRRFSDGDEVHRGDVIGYCGDTGNATVPHVHFGWYGPDGTAIDPMRRLISWLHQSEAELPALLSKAAVGAASLGSDGSTLGIVRSLPDDPLPEASLTAWRNAASTGPHDVYDLTPVLVFLVLFGITGRRTVPGSKRRRSTHRGGSPPCGAMPAYREGPLLS